MNHIKALDDEEWAEQVRLLGRMTGEVTLTAKRVDNNQREIIDALRRVGATVQPLSDMGHGCPDVLCGFRHQNYLMEIKSKGGRLTEDESMWHDQWRGQVVVVRTVEEALYTIGAVAERPVLVRARGEA